MCFEWLILMWQDIARAKSYYAVQADAIPKI